MAYALSGDVRIHWEEEGSGPALLLVMGTGYTLEMWHRVRCPLAERFRVLVFDNRGVGRSDVPPPSYSISAMADDALAVLDAAEEEAAHVVGAWLGGAIAEELALAHPERVRSLVLAGTCAFPHAVDPDDEVLAALTTRTSTDREASARVTTPFIYHPSTPRDRVEEDLVIWLEHYPSKEGYEGQRRASAGYDNRDRLAALDVPVLVLHGDADRLVPTGNGVDLARLIPGARYVEIGDASHNLFTDQPERTLEVIVGFIGALDG